MQVIVFFTILKSMILFKEFANHAFSTIRTTTAAVSPSCLNSSQIEACFGKEELVEILTNAEVPLDHDRCNRLPTWRAMTDLYGEKQIVVGLETCQAYRDMIQTTAGATPMPRIAGLCNSGTNVLNQLLFRNLGNITHVGAPRQGYQVPWGKHAQAKHRLTNIFQNTVENATWVLPIVLIRDPYRWMQSMCKAPYFNKWKRDNSDERHCPNLLLLEQPPSTMTSTNITHSNHSTNATTIQVHLPPPFASSQLVQPNKVESVYTEMRFPRLPIEQYDSLAHYWSTWNRQYLDATYPRLFVRFEDLLLHARDVYSQILNCAGIPINDGTNVLSHDTPTSNKTNNSSSSMNRSFRYVRDKAKNHGDAVGLLGELFKHANPETRKNGYWPLDLDYAKSKLDEELMQLLHYPHPS